MKLIKKTKRSVEMLTGESKGLEVNIWQYPDDVMIEVDKVLVRVPRNKLKAFLGRKP